MTRSSQERGRRPGRIATAAASACLIAAASALAACGNATWSAPPRYDGAGYAVLARALLEGQGYRAIDHPDRPRHAHFPPGYPLLLAAIWHVTSVSAIAAHAASAVCTVGATLAAWCWFRRMMSPGAALLLGLALSVNWLWTRTGGAIQSEPLFLLLCQLTILVAARSCRSASGRAIGVETGALGTLVAACLLTRHVAVGLALAVLIDMAFGRRLWQALGVAAIAGLLVSPWLTWLAVAGSSARTQADLILQMKGHWLERIAGQLVFYTQRIPDQVTGPLVEVGTAFQHDAKVAMAANVLAAAATVVIALGWIRTLRRPRRRLAGLVAFSTLALLLLWPYTEAGRFLIPLIPCILVGAVEGLAATLGWLVHIGGRIGDRRAPYGMRSPRLRLIAASAVLVASLPYSAYALVAGKARATEAAQRDFDAACAWLAVRADRPGPVLTRHPGEVFWQTGRQALEVATSERPGDADADAVAVARLIDAYHVSYLLIDRERYAHAQPSPLARFLARYPERAREVWNRETDRSAVTIYEVEPVR
jgi:Dolichyl-phosphate-mannose-protein mannosyltransferase